MKISSRPAPSPSRSSFPLPPEFPFPVVLSSLFLFLLWPLKAPALQETRERSTAWEPRWRTRTGQNQPRHPSLPISFSFSHTRALPSFSCCVVFAALQTKRKGEERGGPHGQTHTHMHIHIHIAWRTRSTFCFSCPSLPRGSSCHCILQQCERHKQQKQRERRVAHESGAGGGGAVRRRGREACERHKTREGRTNKQLTCATPLRSPRLPCSVGRGDGRQDRTTRRVREWK